MLLPLLFAAIAAWPNERSVVWDRWPDHKPRTVFEVTEEQELVAVRVGRDGKRRRLATLEEDVRGVELLDVTGDGEPEVLFRLAPGNRSTPIEICRWNGHTLERIGETNEQAIFVDLDHDGVNEMIEFVGGEENECDAVAGEDVVTRFRNGRFDEDAQESHAAIVEQTKESAEPLALQQSLFLPDELSTTVRLHIVNGQRGAKHRVTRLGLDVRQFNGDGKPAGKPRPIPVQLGPDDEYADITVTLPSRCTFLDVTTYGPAGATVVIVADEVK